MSKIQEVELSIEHAKKIVHLRDIALKLADNADFKELIMNGYLKDEAVRLAYLSADDSLNPHARQEVFNMIQAIGYFKAYLSSRVMLGNVAERDLTEGQATLQELREEGDEE